MKRKQKFYHLVMLPYASGDLHIGHWYNYGPADVFARMKKMQGFDVFSPIGFDAFGLPAENAAIERGIHPAKWTKQNIKRMRQQLRSINAIYDWRAEVITSQPKYYKWTQWFFLQFYKNGLAYRKKAPCNFCPKCQTVLANEQVIDEKCERCETKVIQKEIEQWFFKITDYADRLLKDLDKLDWPEKTKAMQRNWIGKSKGAEIDFSGIKVFTTRPDTILGATFVVLSSDHPWAKNPPKYVINPANQEKIPVFVADYVLSEYGTGAIMAVPDCDERDMVFAKENNLLIKKTKLVDPKEIVKEVKGIWRINYRLRDWLISRQRYWGAPIPIIYCSKCGEVSVPEKDLPVVLPKDVDFKPTGESPLASCEKFVKTKCPKCQGLAKRETDTMDTFVCSSWYFLRYVDPKNAKRFASKEKIKKWLPVDMYVGGAEHTVLHLLYSRFFTKALKDLGLVDFDEPFISLRHQGFILGQDGQKMSKSRGNVVNPDDYVKKYGSDTVRMYLCFIGPYSQGGPWNPKGIIGIKRFLDKVKKLKQSKEIDQKLTHKTIKKVTNDIEKFRFNTAVSCLMEYVNSGNYDLEILMTLLAPFAPELSKKYHHKPWPKYDEKLIKEEEIELIIQINGKVRDRVKVRTDIDKKEALELIKQRPKIKDLKIKRVIFVPGKLINLVV